MEEIQELAAKIGSALRRHWPSPEDVLANDVLKALGDAIEYARRIENLAAQHNEKHRSIEASSGARVTSITRLALIPDGEITSTATAIEPVYKTKLSVQKRQGSTVKYKSTTIEQRLDQLDQTNLDTMFATLLRDIDDERDK